eukprot:CAMPEP_0202709150 /NCGR_PEP_ID=MMETSP1385-20130828/21280_1 /ASSEMBLY_ACC=CAM_ASM_000861 /TAXON_ID=933848 /ORGANISM="Elphidium margaritaceum" /LENGTH=54 /DNA_ID=CAMNT_0049368321 /DNA_START=1 /DNA_END=162 /DNA_ORIENTATION=-
MALDEFGNGDGGALMTDEFSDVLMDIVSSIHIWHVLSNTTSHDMYANLPNVMQL